MRSFASRFDEIPGFPDTRLTVLLTAGTAQAFDWPTGTDVVRITVASTVSGVAGPLFFEPNTTGAAVATTGGAVTTGGSSGGLVISAALPPAVYRRNRSSTGFSIIAGSSYSVGLEFWGLGG